MNSHPPVIAIDGPAASGKSSTAGAVADALGMIHIDSGALYRTAAWLALEAGVTDPAAITTRVYASPVTLVRQGGALRVVVREADVEDQMRTPAVTAMVSPVSAIPEVRDWVNDLLRDAVRQHGATVMDGRDIGTVVFPGARLKVYLTATAEARARRRLIQLRQAADGEAIDHEAARLAERDRRDSSRAVAPLRRAPDALLLDTTDLEFAEGVAQILRWARNVGLPDR